MLASVICHVIDLVEVVLFRLVWLAIYPRNDASEDAKTYDVQAARFRIFRCVVEVLVLTKDLLHFQLSHSNFDLINKQSLSQTKNQMISLWVSPIFRKEKLQGSMGDHWGLLASLSLKKRGQESFIES